MLTPEQLEANKQEFLGHIQQIKREGANIEGLVEYLITSDFFTAPASTKYHGNFEGGLCRHSLDVYIILTNLIQMTGLNYNTDSIAILALLHDLSKTNFYEKCAKNKKVYTPQGNKSDSLGKFTWITEEGWQVRDEDSRLIYGNHEQNSEYLIRQYIPLTTEECSAILHHHAGMSFDCTQINVSQIYDKYPIAMLLHVADTICTYLYT